MRADEYEAREWSVWRLWWSRRWREGKVMV